MRQLRIFFFVALVFTILTGCMRRFGKEGTPTEAQGNPDLTFGDGGLVTLSTSAGTATTANFVLPLSSGKVLVAGQVGNANYDFQTVRLNQDGSLDTSFGVNGFAVLDFENTNDQARGITLLSSGKILVTGVSSSTAAPVKSKFALAMYNSEGVLDTAFGTGGKLLINLSGNVDYASYTLEQASGKLVVVGYSSSVAGRASAAITRLFPDGSIDPSFGVNGTVSFSLTATSFDAAYFGAMQSDGKMVFGGSTFEGIAGRTLVFRLEENGAFDLSFNGTGKSIFTFGKGAAQIGSLVLSKSEKILVGGLSTDSVFFDGSADFGFAQLNQDGTLDTGFGTNGALNVDFGNTEMVRRIQLQPDGKIIGVGESIIGKNFTSPSKIAITRVNTDGTLDTSFGTNGKYTTTITGYDYPRGIAIQSDLKLLVAGGSINGTQSFWSILRIR